MLPGASCTLNCLRQVVEQRRSAIIAEGARQVSEALAMRDWVLALAPIGAAIYFILNPADFWAFIEWAQHLLFH
jgi:hypothetical protein